METDHRTRRPGATALAVGVRTSSAVLWVGLAVAVSALALILGPPPAHAQFGSPVTYHFRLVDQAGRPLDGSMIRIEGASGDLITPATIDLVGGPQLVTIEPAAQGAMFPGGALRPGGSNGLSRNEFVFLDPMGGDVLIEWRTADVAVSVVDQDGATIAGARWGFAGDGATYAPGGVLLPVTDEGAYPSLGGPSAGGWILDVRAAFDGNPVDLLRTEQREVVEGMSALVLDWRQTSCTMGVVDGAGSPIRGATWTMLGRTFAAGDAITLPSTDESLYPNLAGALAPGFPTTLATNTVFGSGDALFEVSAGGALAPDFAVVNGGSFGLRCGVTAFPPITTGTLVVSVRADGAPFAGAQVTVLDASGATRSQGTGVDGSFQLADVPQGTASVTLALPAGYHAVDPASGTLTATIVAGQATEATFSIAQDIAPPPPPVANSPEPGSYWRHQVQVALRGRGRLDESLADLATKFPQAIFDGFALHPTDPVGVEGVTQVDPDGAGPAAARRLGLADMDVTLEPGNADALRAARRELLVVLLNVVSGRLSLGLVVDAAGTTLEQEIRRLARMINDGLAGNDALACNAARRINAGRAGGASPTYRFNEGGSVIAAGPGDDSVTLRAMRMATGVQLAFTLGRGQRATLDLYDASGRRQARLYEGDAAAGTTAVTWSAAAGRPGVYFARLVTASGMSTAKVIATP